MPGTELFGEEEKKEVLDVLETGVLFRYNHDELRNGHWKAKTFEKEFAEFHGVKYAHMCSSGTTADDISLASIGIGAGDHVIVPPFTYIAPVESILKIGAIPIFAEIDETLNLSPEGIKAAITPQTKAVMLIHMCGSMAKLAEIIDICKEHNLLLIEDTAQALGGTYKGKPLGSYGDVACFSFDFFKIITAGEGGCVITNNEAFYNNAHQYSDHGHDHIGDNRGAEKHPILGTNYRISELHAAIGLAQFRKIDHILERQRANKKVLWETISKFSQIQMREIPDTEGDSATFISFFLPSEELAIQAEKAFAEEGVGAAYWYNNNFHYFKNWEHLHEMKTPFKLASSDYETPQDYKTLDLPKSNDLMSRMFSIQVRVTWTEEELNALCTKIENALNKVR